MAIMRELAVSLHCRGARRAPHHWGRHRNGCPLWSEPSRGWRLRPVRDPPSRKDTSAFSRRSFWSGSLGSRSSACGVRAGLKHRLLSFSSDSSLPPCCRLCAVSLPGDPDHAEAKHVLHGPAPGEGGVRDVLPGSGALPQLLLALPHCLLSFRESLPDFLQVSHRDGGGGTTCCPHASDPGAGGSWQLQGLLKIP